MLVDGDIEIGATRVVVVVGAVDDEGCVVENSEMGVVEGGRMGVMEDGEEIKET